MNLTSFDKYVFLLGSIKFKRNLTISPSDVKIAYQEIKKRINADVLLSENDPGITNKIKEILSLSLSEENILN